VNKVSCKAYGARAQGKLKPRRKTAAKQWDYMESIKEMRQLVCDWLSADLEISQKLHEAKKQLGKRKRLSWDMYCAELGFSPKFLETFLKRNSCILTAIDETNAVLAKRKKR